MNRLLLLVGDTLCTKYSQIQLTSEAWLTGATVGIDQVGTGPIVLTGEGETLVELVLAPVPGVARLAVAVEPALVVHADARVADVRGSGAFVNVLLAVVPLPSSGTRARVLAHLVQTRATILTGLGCTLINILVTQLSLEAWSTGTRVVVDAIKTLFRFWTRDSDTVVNVGGTSCPLEPRETVTREILFRIVTSLISYSDTCGFIFTRLFGTRVIL